MGHFLLTIKRSPCSDTGEYSSLSYFDLVQFHKDRLIAAIASSTFSSTVDVIAFETIPRIDEADAILTALEEVLQEDSQGKLATSALPPVYISFVFPPETEGRSLPYPSTGDRTGPKEIVDLVRKRKAGVNWPIAGIGINCTKTNILKNALELFAQGALEEPRQSEDEKLHLFVSGLDNGFDVRPFASGPTALTMPASSLRCNRCIQMEDSCGTQ